MPHTPEPETLTSKLQNYEMRITSIMMPKEKAVLAINTAYHPRRNEINLTSVENHRRENTIN